MTKNLETPYFLLRESLLRKNVAAFFTALAAEWPNAAVAYSVKTNALPWILQWMDRHGVLAEAVSDDEYELAELCGFEVVDIYRGYDGDKEDLSDPSSASKYRNNLIWILKRKD